VLFESLTPEDHLNLFAAFKGAENSDALQDQVRTMLKDIDLWD
jgi:ABC-type multidrug transport system ATPase subunit